MTIMEIEWTAAAQRALDEARNWSLDASDSLHAPAILLGLLREPECRAAIVLRSCQVQPAAIHARWPALRPREPAQRADRGSPSRESAWSESSTPLSPEILAAVALARDWLADLPDPWTLATEHLLLGLAAGQQEVGCWLRQLGLDPRTLRDEILARYGLNAEPLAMDGPTDAADTLPGQAPFPSPAGLQVAPAAACTGLPLRETGDEPPLGDGSLRLLDASANRAREALRVVEDYLRFVLNDQHLTDRLKTLRHQLTSALAGLSWTDRLAMRDTQADVGTSLTTPTEFSRSDSREVLTANFARLQESLRSLEEFGKVGNLIDFRVIEQLRYQAYTLHKAVHATAHNLARLESVRLYVLVDGRSSVADFEQLAACLIEAGVEAIQLRDKQLDDRELLDRARRLRSLTASSPTLFVVNDRPDLAVLANADGVHVGQEELPVHEVRQIVGPGMLVGVSTHTLQQARQAVLDGASYIGVGPVFPSGTKAFNEFPGLAVAESVVAEIRLPAFAIGGIDGQNVSQVLATGVRRVAVSGAVISAEDPSRAARVLLDRLNRAE
ncbi:MAG: thiamine phosphate synthase [Thermoguttaceae bacterium]